MPIFCILFESLYKENNETMADKDEVKNKRKINWQIGIPVALWIGCVFLGILKVVLEPVYNSEATIGAEEIVNAINSNTFSTFISVVACMLHQHFSSEKEGVSGLSMKKMPFTIIITLVYIVSAAFDAAISHIAMTIIYLLINCGYVICFFCLFLDRKKK